MIGVFYFQLKFTTQATIVVLNGKLGWMQALQTDRVRNPKTNYKS